MHHLALIAQTDPASTLAGTLNSWRPGIGKLIIIVGIIVGALRCFQGMRHAGSGEAVFQGLVPIGVALILAGWIVEGNAAGYLYHLGATMGLGG